MENLDARLLQRPVAKQLQGKHVSLQPSFHLEDTKIPFQIENLYTTHRRGCFVLCGFEGIATHATHAAHAGLGLRSFADVPLGGRKAPDDGQVQAEANASYNATAYAEATYTAPCLWQRGQNINHLCWTCCDVFWRSGRPASGNRQ